MKKIYNITALRADISSIVSEVQVKGTEALILRDSHPAAVLIPYKKYQEYQNIKQKNGKPKNVLSKYAGILKKQAKKKKIDIDNLRDHIDYGTR